MAFIEPMHRNKPNITYLLTWLIMCTCRCCSNHIFILDLTPGFNGLGRDSCKRRRESFNLVHLILEILWYFFLRLGTSAEGANLRARMQSACLLSDMESFKAANPGAVLGDFVRWYSPRDWVEEELVDEETGNVTKKGEYIFLRY